MNLADYASHPNFSRGRYYQEGRDDFRSPFQRDRDRIIHSTAFRRLMHKTQVFVVHEGDLFRTRLTHSIEVAQVARTLARRLQLNEDLAEVVALAHDLGHPPFGHTGEDVLADKMSNHGGFDHNAQAIRILTKREKRYIDFDGLNLSWESLEGIAKHNGPVLGDVPWAMEDLCESYDLELNQHASAEAQLAAIADDIAYNHHDLQDGLRVGLLDDNQILEVPIIARAFAAVDATHANADRKPRRYTALSIFFGWLVDDVYAETRRRIGALAPLSVEEIRASRVRVAAFSEEMHAEVHVLRKFLFSKLYRHPEVMDMREKAQVMLARSFDHAMDNPDVLPDDWCNFDKGNETLLARTICDYLSGMTDRFVSVEWAFAHQNNW